MALWWIIGGWVAVSLLLVAGIAIGSALGYRRGWEDRAAMEGSDRRDPAAGAARSRRVG